MTTILNFRYYSIFLKECTFTTPVTERLYTEITDKVKK